MALSPHQAPKGNHRVARGTRRARTAGRAIEITLERQLPSAGFEQGGMMGFDRIAPPAHRPLPRAATWRFMTELRRRAWDPPVDSRDDHTTVVAGLDRKNDPVRVTKVARQQADRPLTATSPSRA